ncbi:MAG: polysaccharide biosynthesis/export family protein [Desulfobulbus sp.]|jgi:polysaccharide export outer membrane protein|uniref:polysaccharide biosynthesis/export family protein n=1 Tax=Desulfobulbus sp. TaxID=895 RepID=UPI0028523D89|nr:polysaccharide biosynthesis/export family protein [Desulfobulbus sp.]MDR2549744.1 polysaccharide biosynthesis/export family protein [Desulfobulbus sp.]
MKTCSIVTQKYFWAVIGAVFVMAWSCWAAESGSDAVVKDELKEKYRQEVLGGKGQSSKDQEYVIGYRDILYVEVYGEGSMAVGPSNSSQGAPQAEGQDFLRGRGTGAEVGVDGRVSLRHIGDVYVVGMTLPQLAQYLNKLYSTVFSEPNVITSVVQSNSRQYTVMGQVKTPGLFHLDQPMTIVKAIAKAGGLTEWAKSDITVIRQGNDLIVEKEKEKGNDKPAKKVQQFQFDYDDFVAGKNAEKNIQLEPGDVVVVH